MLSGVESWVDWMSVPVVSDGRVESGPPVGNGKSCPPIGNVKSCPPIGDPKNP